jgi:transposase-like protein
MRATGGKERSGMPKVRHNEDQIRHKLRQAETALMGGASILDVCHELSISEATYHRWRKRYAGAAQRGEPRGPAKEDLSRRLKELEKENKRLKQLVGQLMLDNALLKDALEIRGKR